MRISMMKLASCLLCFSLFSPLTAKSLDIGVLPYIGLDDLIKAYKPLTDHLEQDLGVDVVLTTAKDYKSYIDLTQNMEYDIIITASHFGRLAQQESGYIPLFKPATTYHELLIIRQDEGYKHISELEGAKIAIPNYLAQTTILGRQLLKNHGLNPDKDVVLIDALSHKNALYMLLHGRVSAAIVSTGGYRHSPNSIKKELRELNPDANHIRDNKAAIPLIYMASPKLDGKLVTQIRGSIEGFVNDTEAGRRWIRHTRRYKALIPPTKQDMQNLDSHVSELKEVLRQRYDK